MAEIVGERATKEYETRSLQGYVPLGGFVKEVTKTLNFTQVNLKWSDEHKGFYSDGMLGLSNITRHDINAAFDGYMEIRKDEDGTAVFHVFLKASPSSWYYFGYDDGKLMVYSSQAEFNKIISGKSNAGKAKMGDFVLLVGDKAETLEFIDGFRKKYLGINTPYSLDSEVSRPAQPQDQKKKADDDDGF
jgi:hypothetical protein